MSALVQSVCRAILIGLLAIGAVCTGRSGEFIEDFRAGTLFRD